MITELYTDIFGAYFEHNYEQVIVFSSLIELGLGKEDIVSLPSLFEDLSNSGLKLMFPSYTYSSRRRGQFHESKTPPDPQSGVLSRLIYEKRTFAMRTNDPDYSYLILDNSRMRKMSHEHKFSKSFGVNSYHEQIFNSKTGILLLGPVLETGLTPILHLESLFGVPWRTEIKTEFFCEECQTVFNHFYFAKKIDFSVDKLPIRKNLESLISSAATTSKQSDPKAAWCIFDWNKFSEFFFESIGQNTFFQSLNREKKTHYE